MHFTNSVGPIFPPTFRRSDDFCSWENIKLDLSQFDPFLSCAVEIVVQCQGSLLEEVRQCCSSTKEIERCVVSLYHWIKNLNPSISADELECIVEKCGQQLESLPLKNILTPADLWKMTDDTLERICSNCPNLKSLDLSSCYSLSASVASIVRHCPQLESLSLRYGAAQQGLGSLAGCSHLRALDLGHCRQLTDAALTSIASGCTVLNILDISEGLQIGDGAIAAVATHCLGLQKLNLYRCTSLTDCALESLARCSQLKKLELWGCINLTKDGIISFIRAAPNLTYLGVKEVPSMTKAVIDEIYEIRPTIEVDSFVHLA